MSARISIGKIVIALASALALAVLTASTASAQIAKSGKPRGPTGFHGEGTLRDFGDGNMGWFGEFWGIGYNDEGKGFMHDVSWWCTGQVSLSGGKSVNAGGFCTITDKDGDKINLIWQQEKVVPAGTSYNKGTYLSGTGKYQGITGYYILEGSALADRNWTTRITGGEYRLP